MSSSRAGARQGNGSADRLRACVAPLFRLWDRVNVRRSGADVIVHGSYFTGNVGDRAIGLVICRALREAGLSVVLVSRFFADPPGDSVLVVGGGGVIHDDYVDNLRYRTEPARRADSTIYFAVGSPGLSGLGEAARNRLTALALARDVSVRDEESARILSRYVDGDIRVWTDPAWSFGSEVDSGRDPRSGAVRAAFNVGCGLGALSRPRPTAMPAEKVGLALRRDFDHANLPSLLDELARLRHTARLFFIPFAPEDVCFWREHLRGIGVTCFPASDPVRTFRRVEAMDRMIAMRYHSLVFSALTRRPVVALAYARKVWTLGRQLGVETVDVQRDSHPVVLEPFRRADENIVIKNKSLAARALRELGGQIVRMQ